MACDRFHRLYSLDLPIDLAKNGAIPFRDGDYRGGRMVVQGNKVTFEMYDPDMCPKGFHTEDIVGILRDLDAVHASANETPSNRAGVLALNAYIHLRDDENAQAGRYSKREEREVPTPYDPATLREEHGTFPKREVMDGPLDELDDDEPPPLEHSVPVYHPWSVPLESQAPEDIPLPRVREASDEQAFYYDDVPVGQLIRDLVQAPIPDGTPDRLLAE